MKTILLSSALLVSAGATMHHFNYCPLQHLMRTLAHHKTTTLPVKDAKSEQTAVLAMNK